jgi:hypothetical protein
MRVWVLLVFALMAVSCGSKNSPSSPANNGSALTFNFPYVFASIGDNNGVPLGQVNLVDSNGPVTDAAVTFTYNGGSAPLTYSDIQTEPVTLNGFEIVNLLAAQYLPSAGLGFTAGQPCTLTAAFGGKTYSSSVTTVGNVNFVPGTGSVTVSWAGGGNNDELDAISGGQPVIFSPVTSPYIILNSSLPGYTPGTFLLEAKLENDTAFSGLSSGSYFNATEFYDTVY